MIYQNAKILFLEYKLYNNIFIYFILFIHSYIYTLFMHVLWQPVMLLFIYHNIYCLIVVKSSYLYWLFIDYSFSSVSFCSSQDLIHSKANTMILIIIILTPC